jgi:DNA-binding SARP family transcriptional activator/WD40 repeat protein/energy-coupling factor transporter ATP-binding protein EcfA2
VSLTRSGTGRNVCLMGIAVLGPLTVDDGAGRLSPRDRVVLAALVFGRGRAVASETLADALWRDERPRTAAKIVQNCVARLRKALGAGAIETVPGGYRLTVPPDAVDVTRFERSVARAGDLLTLGETDRAAFLIDEALALWRGAALSDLDGWGPGELEANRLEQLRLDAEELGLEARLRAGRFRDVLADGEATVTAAPLRERRWELLALAQYQAGRQAEALDTVRRARQALADDLGLDPGPGLVALQTAILRQDPSLVASSALPEPSDRCPYVGLVPYGVDDAEAFFGRDREVADCLLRLADQGVLVVVGPSGSGKSSLLRAGVAAALQRRGQRVEVITPGPEPTKALPPRAGATSRRPVLVVDQCEEVVTLCRDREERSRFFAAVADHAADGEVVVALRADRLGEVSTHPAFARIVERGLHLLGRMDAADLRAAIEGPAHQAGLLLEAGLVDLLLRDVEGEPGALPLLSHALRETWEGREGRTLTVAGYLASGGIRGAVAQSAEQVYEQAQPELRPVLRDLLLRLVSPSPEGEPVRTRVPRRQVLVDTEHEQMIEQLVRARLVTSDEDAIELAHEALARAWPRLRGWLDDDVDGQHIRRHLTAAAESWDGMGRPDSELYRGVRLDRAVEWRDRTGPDLSPPERAFLEASEERAEVERRAGRRRRRGLVAALSTVLTVTAILATTAFLSQQRAVRAADLARSRELTAAASATVDRDPALAKLLALAAAEASDPSVDTLRVLHRTYAEDRVVDRYRWPQEHEVGRLTTDLHPDGTQLVAAGAYGGPSSHLEVYDLETDEVRWSFDVGSSGPVIDQPRFTPDGVAVVAAVLWDPDEGGGGPTAEDELGILVWDAETGELLQRHEVGACGGMLLDVAASSVLVQTLAEDPPRCWADASGSSLRLELVDLETGASEVLSARSWGREAALSADGRRVAVTEDAATGPATVVLDVATGTRLLEFDPLAHEGHGHGVVRALSPDGSLLAVGYQPIVIWDVVEGTPTATFHGHAGEAVARFAPDGSSVYSAGVDSTLRRWDPRTGEELAVYRSVGAGLWPSVTTNGRALVPDPATGSAALVDTDLPAEIWGVDTCEGLVWAQTLDVGSQHGALSIQCGDDSHTYVIDLARREVAHTLSGHRGQDLVVSPDGTRFVRQEGVPPDGASGPGPWYGPLQVRALATGEALTEMSGVCTWDDADPEGRAQAEQPGCVTSPDPPFWLYTWSMAWSPDDRYIVASGGSAGLAAWDAASGELVARRDVCGSFAQGLLFDPDGDELYVFCNPEGRLAAVSTETWEPVRTADLAPGVEARDSMALAGTTPDGRWLLGIGGAFFHGGVGLLHWIDRETLEIDHTLARIHEGTPKSWAMSPDGTLLATGASDGSIKVWDVTARVLVHEMNLGDTQVQGLAFVGDTHLAVAPEEGGMRIYTIGTEELLRIVRGSLTRGFTATECARYDLDPCPTLSDIRAAGSAGRTG